MGSSDKGRHWLEIKGQQEVSLEHFFADSSLLQCHASGISCVPLWPQLLLAGWEGRASSKSLALTGLRGTNSAPCPFRSRGGNALKLLHSLADTKSFWFHELVKYIMRHHLVPPQHFFSSRNTFYHKRSEARGPCLWDLSIPFLLRKKQQDR